MNILILSAGTRNLLVSYFMKSGFEKVVAVDASPLAPALYLASSHYLVPLMKDPGYLGKLLEICESEKIDAVLPLQEDELNLLSENASMFEERGIKTIVSASESVHTCRDKYEFWDKLSSAGIPVLKTYYDMDSFKKALVEGSISFPVFIKPRSGCGSADSFVAKNLEFIEAVESNYGEEFIIQQLNTGKEYGADIYVDLVSGEITDIFVKEKLRMRAGETEKSVSVKNNKIYEVIKKTVSLFDFKGPIDMDLFEMDGEFYVSEINPRFGGGYPHAYLCGVDFPGNILNNVSGKSNEVKIGSYKEGVTALKMQDIMTI